MSSGALTDKQKVALEERTALLINLAGVTAQKTLSAYDQGISTRRFYKILANVIIDWHWLSHNHSNRFQFNGVGNLVWIPHKFGALGEINPSIEYEHIKLYHGRFPNMLDMFGSTLYANYGFRGVKKSGSQHYLLFPAFIAYDVMSKSRLEPQEWHFWAELVKIYANLSDSSLDALASCRTQTMSTHSLWIQFIMWKRHMGIAIDILRDQYPTSLDSATTNILLGNIDSARACIKQIFVKIQYYSVIREYMKEVENLALRTEFHSFIPCAYELDSPIPSKYEKFVELSHVLEALHDVCREFQIHMGLDKKQQTVALATLKNKLQYIGETLGLSVDLVDYRKWHSLFLQDRTRKETARLILELIESSFEMFEKILELKIQRPSGHYDIFLKEHYPLPSDKFIDGN